MLGFFRRIVKSRVGLIVAFAILALIAFAFAAGDVTGLQTAGGGAAGDAVAKIGEVGITNPELRRRAQDQLESIRQQQPAVDMTQYVSQGGLDATLDRMVNALALEEFANESGLVVGKALVDAQLASFPSLQGPTGKFDQALYERLLSQRRLTDTQVRADIARETIAQHLVLPTLGASQVPEGVALPYASLLLERRGGQIAFVPRAAVGPGAPPTDAEVQAWYRRNVARYSLPERRIARYARVSPDAVKAQAVPTDAEIAQAYQGDRAKYQPTEKRTITQVTVLDQAAAATLAAKIKAGTAIGAAARAAGLEPRTLTGVEKAGYAAQSTPAVADAAFGAASGSVIGPIRGSIGFVVAKIESVAQVPGRTLAEARDEIATTLTQQKTAEAMGKVQDALGAGIDGDGNFTELVADQKLQAQVTPALTANGLDADNPQAKPDPALAPIMNAAFAAAEGDAPQIVATGADGSFAVVALERIVSAAPRPLAAIRAAVANDFAVDRARAAARRVAIGVVAAVGKGSTLPAALAATNLKLPAVQSLAAARAQIAANPRAAQAPIVLMFSMAAGTAKMLEAPDNAGWYIVKLDRIVPGDAAAKPNVVLATRADLGRAMGREYVAQFTNAVRRAVGVTRNPAALAKVKADLTGQGSSDRQ